MQLLKNRTIFTFACLAMFMALSACGENRTTWIGTPTPDEVESIDYLSKNPVWIGQLAGVESLECKYIRSEVGDDGTRSATVARDEGMSDVCLVTQVACAADSDGAISCTGDDISFDVVRGDDGSVDEILLTEISDSGAEVLLSIDGVLKDNELPGTSNPPEAPEPPAAPGGSGGRAELPINPAPAPAPEGVTAYMIPTSGDGGCDGSSSPAESISDSIPGAGTANPCDKDIPYGTPEGTDPRVAPTTGRSWDAYNKPEVREPGDETAATIDRIGALERLRHQFDKRISPLPSRTTTSIADTRHEDHGK